MCAAKSKKIVWLPDVEEHNYPAARSYLSLIYKPSAADSLVRALRRSPLVEFKAKDIFRASGLSLLGVSNAHVERDREKIRDGVGLAPLLLVRDGVNGKVVIADGYHRLCAVYETNEDAWIQSKIV